MTKLAKVSLLFLLVVAFLTSTIMAQTTGSISGEVRDEKQAVVTNATVLVRNVKTNETRTAQTDSEGRYRFTGVQVGDYEVTVEATGSQNMCKRELAYFSGN